MDKLSSNEEDFGAEIETAETEGFGEEEAETEAKATETATDGSGI